LYKYVTSISWRHSLPIDKSCLVTLRMGERAPRTKGARQQSEDKTGVYIPSLRQINLGPQGVEIFLDLPSFGPFVNLALESILGAFFFDSSL